MLNKHYMLVTKSSCPHCQNAFVLLKENECSFAYTDMENALNLLETVKEQADWKTVPMIWEQTLEWEDEQPVVVENNFIGGYSELSEIFEKSDKND
jgi:glutaredoxin